MPELAISAYRGRTTDLISHFEARKGSEAATKRRCVACDAFLCSYNPEDICWCHQPIRLGEDTVLVEVEHGRWDWVPVEMTSERRAA